MMTETEKQEQLAFRISRIRAATSVDNHFCDEVVAYSTATCDVDNAASYCTFTDLRLPAGYSWALCRELPMRFLRLGDTVRTGCEIDGFGIAAVVQVTDTEVAIFAPYVTTDDFSYTGGVIAYIGVQQWKAPRSHSSSYFVYRRKELA